jgi:hypothetical protein
MTSVHDIYSDVVATLMALDNGDTQGADLMLRTYADDAPAFVTAALSVALNYIRAYSRVTGTTPRQQLVAYAVEIRAS